MTILYFLFFRHSASFIATEELQAIPSFDLKIITQLRAFVSVRGGVDNYQVPILKMMAEGRNEILARWRRRIEKAKGFKEFTGFIIPLDERPVEFIANQNPYQGDENAYYFRYQRS